MVKKILNSREVMEYLSISENTLLKYESAGVIKIAFRLGNRKRYYVDDLTFEKK
jgi:predicted site-specific integrase-resolvase